MISIQKDEVNQKNFKNKRRNKILASSEPQKLIRKEVSRGYFWM